VLLVLWFFSILLPAGSRVLLHVSVLVVESSEWDGHEVSERLRGVHTTSYYEIVATEMVDSIGLSIQTLLLRAIFYSKTKRIPARSSFGNVNRWNLSRCRYCLLSQHLLSPGQT